MNKYKFVAYHPVLIFIETTLRSRKTIRPYSAAWEFTDIINCCVWSSLNAETLLNPWFRYTEDNFVCLKSIDQRLLGSTTSCLARCPDSSFATKDQGIFRGFCHSSLCRRAHVVANLYRLHYPTTWRSSTTTVFDLWFHQYPVHLCHPTISSYQTATIQMRHSNTTANVSSLATGITNNLR